MRKKLTLYKGKWNDVTNDPRPTAYESTLINPTNDNLPIRVIEDAQDEMFLYFYWYVVGYNVSSRLSDKRRILAKAIENLLEEYLIEKGLINVQKSK